MDIFENMLEDGLIRLKVILQLEDPSNEQHEQYLSQFLSAAEGGVEALGRSPISFEPKLVSKTSCFSESFSIWMTASKSFVALRAGNVVVARVGQHHVDPRKTVLQLVTGMSQERLLNNPLIASLGVLAVIKT